MQLNELANINMGQSPIGSSLNDIQGLEFHQGKIFFGDISLKKSLTKTTAPTKIANTGDIVVCVRAPVGEVNLVPRKICIGRGLAALTPKENVPTRFLLHLLRNNKRIFERISSGSTFESITTDQLKMLSLAVPSSVQQHHIASITQNKK